MTDGFEASPWRSANPDGGTGVLPGVYTEEVACILHAE